jgi:hypothetical protein
LTKPNETDEANIFDEKYKKLNKVLPNQFAVRGFDVTMDTLLRLSQDVPFEESVQTTSTEFIENKFERASITRLCKQRSLYTLL